MPTERASALPLTDVRLRPSDYATAVKVNLAYLLSLSADRLLHNFRKYAGLKPKAPIYGGWESDTLSGHTLGHYMTALVLAWQQTGNAEFRNRADYIVEELAICQKKRGNGYVGGLGRKTPDGKIVDGEPVFVEVTKGDIRSGGFDLNGSWSPLYTVHKLFAGLLDIHAGWGNSLALDVVTGLGEYFAGIFAALDDAGMQALLGCEYGGLNESFAELSARTGDKRWIAVAERIYDRKVLDPLAEGVDKLANFHANTQVPKVIGLARIYELNGQERPAQSARFFWETVTRHHSYVIGGNADREYFSAPDTIADHITEATCEHCNSYNMLKLTRHLFSWKPDGELFDYYERAHLNHIMAAHNPQNGGFSYMTPMMTGARRGYSSPQGAAFWCCVGTGMESHAKHGDSIFWEAGDMLFVNLYIPSDVQWQARGVALSLETSYPFEPDIRLNLKTVRNGRFRLALRIPGWAKDKATLSINGETWPVTPVNGYAIIARKWKSGDAVQLNLPLDLRFEAAPGAPNMLSVVRGPLVMAADLGPAELTWKETDPTLIGDDPLSSFRPLISERPRYQAVSNISPRPLEFVPFYSQYDRLSAVYFRHFSADEWKTEEKKFQAEIAREKDIANRSVDIMHLGEMQPERDHDLTSSNSWPTSYRGRNGREARSGGHFEFNMAVKRGAMSLLVTYWGGERSRMFDILVNGKKIATQKLNNDQPGRFVDISYPLDPAIIKGQSSIRVRFVPHEGNTAGPVFGVRTITAERQPEA